jgi:hypothetical protein
MVLEDFFPEIFDTSKMPKIVYHYTSVQGLYGIVMNGAIWANDYRFLNDADEIEHVFTQLPPELDHNNSLYDVYSLVFGEPNYLIASFSERDDDLSMWGRYTKDEGLSLGFSRDTLMYSKAKEDKFQKPTIGKCIYNSDDKIEIVSKLVSSIGSDNTDSLLNALITIAPFFKNESFANENEWRLVFEHKPSATDEYGKPLYRISQGKIIPYMQVLIGEKTDGSLRLNRFEEIVLSPKLCRVPRSELMIRNYLASSNIKVEAIRQSISSLA